MAQIHCNFHSYSIGCPVEIEVTIPSLSSCDGRDGAPISHNLPAKFPVIYLLHGGGNDYRCWLRYTSAERYAEEHRVALVTCSVGNSAYENKEGRGEKYFDFVAKELPEFVCSYFPISDRPEDTFMLGYSMGGYGTIIHTFEEPEKYAAVGFFSPGVPKPAKDATDNLLRRLPHNPYEMAAAAAEKGVKLPEIFMCIGQDDFLYEAVTDFHQHLNALEIEHRYDDLPGYEHEFAIWDRELLAFMDWMPRSDYYADKIPHKI